MLFIAYTKEESVKSGLIQKSKTPVYSGFVLMIMVDWFVYRKSKKKRKQNSRDD